MRILLGIGIGLILGIVLMIVLFYQPVSRPNVGASRRSARMAFERAYEHAGRFEYEKAIAELDAVVAQDPDNPAAWGNRGLYHLALRDPDRAIPDLERHMALDPYSANPFSNRGIAYILKGDHERALADYRTAIKKAPGDLRRVRDLAFLNFNDADYVAAETTITPIAHRDDAKTATLHYLIRARLGLDAKAKLREEAAALSDRVWPYPVVLFLLDELTADGLRAAAKDRGERCTADYYIGETALIGGDVEAAVLALAKVRESCPGDYDEYYGALADLRRMTPPR